MKRRAHNVNTVFTERSRTMLELKAKNQSSTDHEMDLALWYARQAELLRESRFDQLDVNNLIDELEAAVGNLRRELSSRIEVLLTHLLKCQFQPQRISRSWLNTLDEQRSQIAKLLDENRSLGPGVTDVAAKVYPLSVRRAVTQTGLPRSTFPLLNPYSKDQLFDFDFVP
ncbi:hypothetical protein CR105_18230 [Massilia eurypsychrophila]|uniref:DUF29 domain-containing protein n=2 Tax=Massilia eurypsychrophila TaxID=1485217 RepID=A0A2G8TCC1_9BURK|nr:hypothetical protein CR105_18230 [Massilia eurypsychrophila]